MPIKMSESSCYYPGALVEAEKDLYSSNQADGMGSTDNHSVRKGTVGVILKGPDLELGYRDHYQVQFLSNRLWWVLPDEISPYVGY
jgi:hypothetical protein